MLDKKKTVIIYIIFSICFICLKPFGQYPMSYLIKSVPAFVIAFFFIFFAEKNSANRILGVGFIFSAFGDIFLELDRVNFFIHGLGAFLIAHIFYSIAFFKKSNISKLKWWKSLIPILFTGAVCILIYPNLGKLTIPVLLYISVITIMALTASIHENEKSITYYGALVFMVSDSLIAINKFLYAIPNITYLTITTYYLGHYLMAHGNFSGRKIKPSLR